MKSLRDIMKKPMSKHLEALRAMPRLKHRIADKPFNIHESEVVQWLKSNDGLMQWLFGKVNDRAIIVFDEATGEWKGSNTP